MGQAPKTASLSGITCMVEPLAHSICTRWLEGRKRLSGRNQETRGDSG